MRPMEGVCRVFLSLSLSPFSVDWSRLLDASSVFSLLYGLKVRSCIHLVLEQLDSVAKQIMHC